MPSLRFTQALVTIVLFICTVNSQSEEEKCLNAKEILNQLLQNYDKNTAPALPGKPVEVKVELRIQSFYELNQESNSLKLDVFVAAVWNDERLQYEKLKDRPCNDIVKIDGSKIWTPDLNLIDSRKTEIIPIQGDSKLARLHASAEISFNQRMKLTIPCNFRTAVGYPFDEVTCAASLESYWHSIDQITLDWSANPIIIQEVARIPGFRLVNSTAQDYLTLSKYDPSANSGVRFSLIFRRDATATYLYTFVPAILAVFVAGITFFLGRKSSVARAILTTAALFFLIYLIKEVGEKSPKYSGFKMIDIYLFVCILFVCSALIELALANCCTERGHYELDEGFRPLNQSEASSSGGLGRFCRRHCGKVDVSAGFLYFALFIAWNVVYFLVLAVLEHNRS